MRVLAVDVGTGTQDILLFDSANTIENAVKMVMPSPTAIIADRIRAATRRRQGVLLSGVTMGGGPCAWAADEHRKQGLPLYATPDAARTFNDDLDEVQRDGVQVVGEGERVPGDTFRIKMRDFDYEAIAAALQHFDVSLDLDAVAVAVFDHGAAPPGVSDRLFRFAYIERTMQRQPALTAFAHLRAEVPAEMTRMRAVAATIALDVPTLLMDTGPASVLGALEDPRVAAESSLLVANLGNFHTLAFHVVEGRIAGLFEHHTAKLARARLEVLLGRLAAGTLTNEEVFDDHGHGALTTGGRGAQRTPSLLAVTGPRRGLLRGSSFAPYFAVPHGDMMLAGSFGLLRALAAKLPQFGEELERSLTRG